MRYGSARGGRRRARAWRRGARRACTVALFAAWAALCHHRSALASGVLGASAGASVVGARARTRPGVDVEPGPLADVLAAFAKATGLALELDVPGDVLAALTSPGGRGLRPDQPSLDALLADSPASGRIAGGRIEVKLAYESTVEVSAPEQAAIFQSLPKLPGPLRTAPISVDVVGAEVMEQQAVTSLADAVRNVPGIALAAGEGGFQGDALTIRGFSARGDMYVDGARDFASYYRDTFSTEEVQVVKGPAGMTFGRGSTGGAVNRSSKLPRLERFGEIGFDAGTEPSGRLTLDVSEPLERIGSGTAMRVAAVAHEGDVAGRDVTEIRRLGVAPSIAFGLGTPTRLTLAHLHQASDDVPDYGVPWRFHVPAEVPREAYYGFERGSFLRTDVDATTVRLEHDVGPRVTLRNQVRWATGTRRSRIGQARLPTSATLDTPLEDIVVLRNVIDAESRETMLLDQLDVLAELRSGAVEHSLVAGLELAREDSSPVRRQWHDVPGTPLMKPNPGDTFSGRPQVTSDVEVDADTVAAYVVDTMRFSDRVSAVLGLRWDRFDVDYENRTSSERFDRVDEVATWRAAVVFEPTGHGSVYAGAATSFNPSAENLALSASTADTEPERNRSFEIGSKWDLAGGSLHLRGAAFMTEKTAAREAHEFDSSRQVLAGAQRVRGFEVELDGRLTDRWNLTAGYALMDSKVLESKSSDDAVGEPLANVPRHSFSAWSLHALPARFELGWGVRHVSRRTASSTTPRIDGRLKAVPGYWTADLMVRRPLGAAWSLQLNVANLTDEAYYDQVHNSHVVPGAGRSATLGVRWGWGDR